jgi:hypothetical protein
VEVSPRTVKKNDQLELTFYYIHSHLLQLLPGPTVSLLTRKAAMMVFKTRQSSNSSIEDVSNQDPPLPGTSESEESRVERNLRKRANKESENETDDEILVRSETRVVNVLRVLVLLLLLIMATLTSTGVYFYTSNDEKQKFEVGYQANAERIIESFHDAVERRLGAINSMATSITSYSLDAKQTFPFVTIPNFEIRGSDLRVQSGANSILWLPLVTDETRVAWEEYALLNRSQIDEAFLEDEKQREKQDDEFGLTNTSSTGIRMLQQSQQETILDDGTGYHPRIWSNGGIGPARDQAEGSGPYLPFWQGR